MPSSITRRARCSWCDTDSPWTSSVEDDCAPSEGDPVASGARVAALGFVLARREGTVLSSRTAVPYTV